MSREGRECCCIIVYLIDQRILKLHVLPTLLSLSIASIRVTLKNTALQEAASQYA